MYVCTVHCAHYVRLHLDIYLYVVFDLLYTVWIFVVLWKFNAMFFFSIRLFILFTCDLVEERQRDKTKKSQLSFDIDGNVHKWREAIRYNAYDAHCVLNDDNIFLFMSRIFAFFVRSFYHYCCVFFFCSLLAPMTGCCEWNIQCFNRKIINTKTKVHWIKCLEECKWANVWLDFHMHWMQVSVKRALYTSLYPPRMYTY